MADLIIIDNNIKYQIYPYDLGYGNIPNQALMTWHDAIKSCELLGDGWRLPNKEELYLIYKKKENLQIIPLHGYWSSDEFDKDSAYYQYFFTGIQYIFNKSFPCFVRPIRYYLL